MRIVDIRQRTLPLASALSNSAISFRAMTASAVAVVTDRVVGGKPVVGFAFDSPGRYGHGAHALERFAPRLLEAEPDAILDESGDNFDPVKVWAALMSDEKPGGHGERAGAVGLIDSAIWDIVAKLEEKPLWRLLAERFGRGADRTPRRVPSYATGGYYRDGDDVPALQSELRAGLAHGYTHFKIKAGSAPLERDRRRIEAALSIVGGGGRLAVDLNGTFDRGRATAFLDMVEPYGLRWVEEVGDPLDFELQAELCRRYARPFALGENIFSRADAANLVRYGGLRPTRDILQFDVALSYGLVEYLRILALLDESGWPRENIFPHAGHLLALHVVGGLGLGGHEAAIDAMSFFGGYPSGSALEQGTVDLPEHPGVGFEAHPKLYGALRPLV